MPNLLHNPARSPMNDAGLAFHWLHGQRYETAHGEAGLKVRLKAPPIE